jgi:hypothetical protein
MVGDNRRLLRSLLSKASYRLAGQAGHEFYLFERGPSTPETERALHKLGVAR